LCCQQTVVVYCRVIILIAIISGSVWNGTTTSREHLATWLVLSHVNHAFSRWQISHHVCSTRFWFDDYLTAMLSAHQRGHLWVVLPDFSQCSITLSSVSRSSTPVNLTANRWLDLRRWCSSVYLSQFASFLFTNRPPVFGMRHERDQPSLVRNAAVSHGWIDKGTIRRVPEYVSDELIDDFLCLPIFIFLLLVVLFLTSSDSYFWPSLNLDRTRQQY
jgi:hypothetical protein